MIILISMNNGDNFKFEITKENYKTFRTDVSIYNWIKLNDYLHLLFSNLRLEILFFLTLLSTPKLIIYEYETLIHHMENTICYFGHPCKLFHNQDLFYIQ